MVEFAFVIPLLTLFLFGIIQFGIAYDMKQSINSAGREGARMAAIPDETNVIYPTIRNRAGSSFSGLGGGGIDDLTIEVLKADTPVKTCKVSGCTPATTPVSNSPCTNQPGNTVVVTAIKHHRITIPFFGYRDIELEG